MRHLMLVLFSLVANFYRGGFAQEGGKCDPGICGEIPGLVYDAENNECAWPDEVGCSLADLGFVSSCDGLELHDVKPVDFDMPQGVPEGRTMEQYFVVCVPESTEDDIKMRMEQRARTYFLPSGPLVPRLLACPDGFAFNGESKMCEEA